LLSTHHYWVNMCVCKCILDLFQQWCNQYPIEFRTGVRISGLLGKNSYGKMWEYCQTYAIICLVSINENSIIEKDRLNVT
jgi:hypothetical protein